MRIAPYGSWASPIQPADLAGPGGGISHSYGLCVGERAYWTRSDASDGGRVSLWRRLPDGSTQEVTPGRCVRTGLYEYGGGAWTVGQDASGREVAVYSDWPSGDLRAVVDGEDRLLASGDGNRLRYGSLSHCPAQNCVVGVLEDHTGPGEAVNAVFRIALSPHASPQAPAREDAAQPIPGERRTGIGLANAAKSDSPADAEPDSHTPQPGPEAFGLDAALPPSVQTGLPAVEILASGADFYANPVLRDDGLAAWIEWDHPNMPWDSTRLVAGGEVVAEGASIVYPSWTPEGALLYLSDASGYWNFHRDGSPLFEAPHDFCQPLWNPDPVPYAVVDEHTIACSWLDDGLARLGLLRFSDGGPARLEEVDVDAAAVTVWGHGPRSALRLGHADRPVELASMEWSSGRASVLASEGPTPDHAVSRARAISWDGPAGTVHAWYYPPASDDFQAPDGELPPAQVWSHGGPTAFSSPEYRRSVQFWTTRGIGILDVNYSGSAGFGRGYRERLKGQWGVLDVRDCVDGALALADQGLADRERLSIRGGSAGGYTTLRALTTSQVFAAGISLYGIGNLESLARDTHKFEARYLDGLIAPYPARRQVWLDRSPIFHLDQLNCPMLILQGLEDKVVPPSQAYELAAALEAKGLPVTLITFEGEGHGFRQASSIATTAQAALDFLGRVHGFTPVEV
ncbi:MAG: prolyl oligopeptidase family serine peptidase [Propionibacteriaceae bacterium]|nr:prolyl oligopeptidase family serine peptidase [Propionibacteriaceae bacterium]